MNRQLHPSHSAPSHSTAFIILKVVKSEHLSLNQVHDAALRNVKYLVENMALDDCPVEVEGIEVVDDLKDFERGPEKSEARCAEVYGRDERLAATSHALTNFPVEQSAGTASGSKADLVVASPLAENSSNPPPSPRQQGSRVCADPSPVTCSTPPISFLKGQLFYGI